VPLLKRYLLCNRVPKKVIVLEELPKLPSGKVLKRNLKNDYKSVFEETPQS
jgi:fatty-acyl-CoA synthase